MHTDSWGQYGVETTDITGSNKTFIVQYVEK